MIVADIPELKGINWQMMIIDEAHRLKNTKSKLADLLRQMHIGHKVRFRCENLNLLLMTNVMNKISLKK